MSDPPYPPQPPSEPPAWLLGPRRHGDEGRPAKYPWALLEVYGHFVIPAGAVAAGTPCTLVVRQNTRERKLGSGRRYRLEGTPEAGWRVWRMA
jgi:hypothetical protein